MFATGGIIWSLITSKAGKYLLMAGGVLVALWIGYHALEGHFQNKELLRQYKRADEVRREDKKTDAQIDQEKKRIDGNPKFDLDAEFKRLRDHARQGQD
ncbi:MAG: hypothetical protein ACYC6G_17155 [Desulfobaccales bacterium]